MFEIGRVCMKIAGRDANKYCVILKKVDANHVLVDGETRRKNVNIKHLEPTSISMDIKENADHSVVVESFAKHDIKIALKKSKKATERPKKVKAVKEKKVKQAPKKTKKESVKEEKAEQPKVEKKAESKPVAKVEEKPKAAPKQAVKKE